MTAIAAPPQLPVPAPRPEARDRGIDLVRALCVVAVVLLHSLQLSVTAGATGPALVYATVGQPWYPPLTWALQIMPLFFVIGGFAGHCADRRHRARGGTAAGFVAGRVHRLLLPAVVTVGVMGTALALLADAGMPRELVHEIGHRYGEPLWFLAVFLGCQAVLPVMVAWHERAPWRTLGVLVGASVAVDVAGAATGLPWIGYLNVVFVWLALQQVGLLLADGHIGSLRPRIRVLVAAEGVVLLGGAMLAGVWSPDLIAHLNPPSVALLLMGAVQVMVLSLVRGPLSWLAGWGPVRVFTDFVSARTMTIYLWHMPVLLGMALVVGGVATVLGVGVPAVGGVAWWATRPVWFGVAVVVTGVVAGVLGGIEGVPGPVGWVERRRVVWAVVVGIGGVVVPLGFGAGGVTLWVAAVGMGVGVAMVGVEPVDRTASRILVPIPATRTASRSAALMASHRHYS